MKKLVLAAVTASLLTVCSTSYAAAPAKIFVKGSDIESDVPPVIDNGRVLVPLRAITASLGVSVSWNPKSKTATIRKWSETVKLTADKNTVYYNKAGRSNKMTLDVPVKMLNKRVYVPLRFLAQFYGYQVAATGDAVSVNSPLSQNEQDLLYRGELDKAREMVMDVGPMTAHYAHNPIPYTHEREGFENTFLFPIGEADRFYLLSGDTVSFYELKDDFFVITWQAHIPLGQEDILPLFLKGKVTGATGSRPETKEFFFYRKSGYMTSTNITAGKIGPDGEITETGVKRITGGEVTEQSGSLALKLPGEIRAERDQ